LFDSDIDYYFDFFTALILVLLLITLFALLSLYFLLTLLLFIFFIFEVSPLSFTYHPSFVISATPLLSFTLSANAEKLLVYFTSFCSIVLW